MPLQARRSSFADAVVFAISLVLSALAGFIDATGFVAFGKVFISFMAGDGTRAAIDVSGQIADAIAPILAILFFVVGVVVGELVGAASGRWGRASVLVVEAALLWSAVGSLLSGFGRDPTISLLALAMGVQNASVHKSEDVDVSLTYVTGMVVHVGRALAQALRGKPGWRVAGPLAALWGAVIVGSLVGAVVARHSALAALLVAGSVASVMTIVAVVMVLAKTGGRRLPLSKPSPSSSKP